MLCSLQGGWFFYKGRSAMFVARFPVFGMIGITQNNHRNPAEGFAAFNFLENVQAVVRSQVVIYQNQQRWFTRYKRLKKFIAAG